MSWRTVLPGNCRELQGITYITSESSPRSVSKKISRRKSVSANTHRTEIYPSIHLKPFIVMLVPHLSGSIIMFQLRLSRYAKHAIWNEGNPSPNARSTLPYSFTHTLPRFPTIRHGSLLLSNQPLTLLQPLDNQFLALSPAINIPHIIRHSLKMTAGIIAPAQENVIIDT